MSQNRKNPTKHQYDYDVTTVYGFLKQFGLGKKKLKLILKLTTRRLLAIPFQHEIATTCALDIFGSIDANRGDPQLGWDTDQFPNSVGRKYVSYV